MARKAINKKSFEGGLVNAVDSKDLDTAEKGMLKSELLKLVK